MILKHVMSGICTKMNRTKQLPSDVMETPLNRCLTTLDITLLGLVLLALKKMCVAILFIFHLKELVIWLAPEFMY